MKIEKLFNNEFVEVRKIIAPDKGINGYIYAHDPSCDSQKVAILPFRRKGQKLEFLLREEVVPPWSVDVPYFVSITGGVEKYEDPLASAVKELKEESGYRAIQAEMIELGKVYASKYSDMVFHLFTVDLTDRTHGIPRGDGSILESMGRCVWRRKFESYDPVLYALHLRIYRILKKRLKTGKKITR